MVNARFKKTAQRTTLIKLFCNLFVRLHNLDWRPFASDDIDHQSGEPYLYVDNWFVQARDALRQYSAIDLYPVLNWLEARRDALDCHRPSPVHQDFHPGNILVRADDRAVVIDWTDFSVSDYRFDLAWTLMLVNAYSGQEQRAAILEEYEKQMASQVQEIETFEVFACASRLFVVFVSLSEGAQRLGMRPEAVEAMKQQMHAVERVYQMLTNRTGIVLRDVEALIQQGR